MAFRKELFLKHGGFRTDMGPCPGSELRNEDTEFGRRIMRSGERLWYEPAAVVYHEVPEARLTKKYFLAFWFDHGRASVREWGQAGEVFGIPRRYFSLVKLSGSLTFRTVRWVIETNPQRRFYWRGIVWSTAGKLVEIRRELRARQFQEA